MAKKTTDNKTLDLIREVNRQKADITKAEGKPNWITNCSFVEAPGTAPINLHVETNIQKLIGIVGFLLSRERAYCEAVPLLDAVDPPSFAWQGFPVKDWTEDVKTRINKLQIESKKKNLEKLESRLNSIISPELRAQMELEAIEAELKVPRT